MPRLPRAKALILKAAREIVENSGAGALTYDKLSRISGVTRGGITYHFPTKDALLQGLLENDMVQWKEGEEASRPTDVACPRRCELIGFIRTHTSEDEGRRRFITGMLSAAVHQPELLEGCRSEVMQRYAGVEWNEADLRAHVLRLAAVGLFWDEIFGFQPMDAEARTRFVALLERLAREWTVDLPPSPTTTRKQT